VGYPLLSLPGKEQRKETGQPADEKVEAVFNPNSALEIYYSFQLLQIQGFQNNF
jgi:hypothetical protein